MKRVRATVDMIAVFRAGEIPEPIRFRFWDRMGKETVIKVGKVIDLSINNYNTPKDITALAVRYQGTLEFQRFCRFKM